MKHINEIEVEEPIIITMKTTENTLTLAEKVEIMTNRFGETIYAIVKTENSIKVTFKDDVLVYAKVNVNAIFKSIQIKALFDIVEEYNLIDFQISRSGAGLKIEFNPKYKE